MSSRRTFTVVENREAMEVTAENLDEVAAWCDGVANDAGEVMFSTGNPDRDTDFVWPGYVLVHAEPFWYTVPVESFELHSVGWTEVRSAPRRPAP